MYLTEQQRLDALRACGGIEAANAKLQQACKNILEILARSANPTRQPREGDSAEGDLTGEA